MSPGVVVEQVIPIISEHRHQIWSGSRHQPAAFGPQSCRLHVDPLAIEAGWRTLFADERAHQLSLLGFDPSAGGF
jgi:hypothetical protein